MSYYPNYYDAAQALNEQRHEAFHGNRLAAMDLASKFGTGRTRRGTPYQETDPRYVTRDASAWGYGGFVHRRASDRKASRRASDRKTSRRKASRRASDRKASRRKASRRR